MTEKHPLSAEAIVNTGADLIDAAVNAADTPLERAEIVAAANDGLHEAGLELTDITVKPLTEGDPIPGSDGLWVATNPEGVTYGPKTLQERRAEVVAKLERNAIIRRIGGQDKLTSELAVIAAKGALRRTSNS